MHLHDRLLLPPRLARAGFAWIEALSRGVRVHVGPEAQAMTRAAHARALAVGRDLYFREGSFAPATPRGLALLAHELVHVWQHAEAGGLLGRAEDGRHEDALEARARAVESSVLALMDAPADDPADRRVSLEAPPALQLARAPRPAPVPDGGPAATRPAARLTAGLPLRAPEAPPAEPAGAAAAAAADPAELAGQVLRVLERRLCVDRERLGMGMGVA